MKKVLIALLPAVVLSLTLVMPVLADEGGERNENAGWGWDRSFDASTYPGFVGDYMSNGHQGHKGSPPHGQGGNEYSHGPLPQGPP